MMADGSCLLAFYVQLTMAGWQDVRGPTMDEGCAEESHKSSSFFCRAAFSAFRIAVQSSRISFSRSMYTM